MKTKEYYIKLIIGRVLWYNESWGDKLPNSELVNNTEEAVEALKTYCTLIKNNKKCVENNFENNPEQIKMLVNEIIKIVWGDNEIVRECKNKADVKRWNGNSGWIDKNDNYHHLHVSNNGYLYIENEPKRYSEIILSDIDELNEIIESDKHTVNLEKYLHKWYSFPGYEDGSAYIYISEINFKDNEYVYTGGHIFMTTVNNYGDGVLINDVEDDSFGNLPYTETIETADELVKILDAVEETSLNNIKDDIIASMNNYWFNDKDFSYDMKKYMKS